MLVLLRRRKAPRRISGNDLSLGAERSILHAWKSRRSPSSWTWAQRLEERSSNEETRAAAKAILMLADEVEGLQRQLAAATAEHTHPLPMRRPPGRRPIRSRWTPSPHGRPRPTSA